MFNAVEKQTGYTIFANKELLKGAKPVTAAAVDMPLLQFLDLVLTISRWTTRSAVKPFLLKINSLPVKGTGCCYTDIPPVTITGTVRSTESTPLEGATVSVKGSGQSVVTDAAGRYTISAEKNQTLVFSFVGYVGQEVADQGPRLLWMCHLKNQ